MISIVLPTYNGARWLGEAIDSCLAQTERDFELIVVVDGSTDDTDRVLARYEDPRVIVERTANQGLPRALNTGFARARGEYWTWTSDDNRYKPEALAVLRAALERSRSAVVCTDCLLIDDAGRAVGYDDQVWACFLYRADAARAVGEYRPELRLVEDVDFFLRLQHHGGPIDRVRAAHYEYRVHAQSLSHRQLGKRQVASLLMHYDLITRGILRTSLRDVFDEKLTVTAALRDWESFDRVVAFAREKQVPFLAAIDRRARLLRTPPGWLYNRARLALKSRLARARQRVNTIFRGRA